jgi:hypothetical protein
MAAAPPTTAAVSASWSTGGRVILASMRLKWLAVRQTAGPATPQVEARSDAILAARDRHERHPIGLSTRRPERGARICFSISVDRTHQCGASIGPRAGRRAPIESRPSRPAVEPCVAQSILSPWCGRPASSGDHWDAVPLLIWRPRARYRGDNIGFRELVRNTHTNAAK